jgi:hypothetical protein
MLKCGRALQLSETETETGLDIGTHGHQLKGQQSRIGNSITGDAFEAMMEAIQTDRTPNCCNIFSTPGRQGAETQLR